MRALAWSAISMSGVSVCLLAYALFGDPPYSFFGAMKAAVVFAVALAVVSLVRVKAAYALVAGPLVYLAFVHLTGKMRRQEWVPWNWAMLVGLLVATVLLGFWMFRGGSASHQGEEQLGEL